MENLSRYDALTNQIRAAIVAAHQLWLHTTGAERELVHLQREALDAVLASTIALRDGRPS